ncbi:hypothetical protein [Streptomyces sp. cg35]|uniref:hypothetical protein n=1 Tax=Streptomyces sp. cg35 TaxID=3421650 RepID=UPI003D169D4A
MRGERDRPAPGLAAHLRTVLWGPAEFVGLPGRSLLTEGLFAGGAAGLAVVGAGFAGMWVGPSALRSGELGLVAVAALTLYLLVLRAGRVLIGLVVLLGACLALYAPRVATDVVLAERGLEQYVRVTAVEDDGARGDARGDHFCVVAGDALPLPAGTRIRRGCGSSTRPGDVLPVLYDPRGRAATRGVASRGEVRAEKLRLAGLAAAFVGGSTLAVVRSFRLTGARHGP